jgi:hypothetical protein
MAAKNKRNEQENFDSFQSSGQESSHALLVSADLKSTNALIAFQRSISRNLRTDPQSWSSVHRWSLGQSRAKSSENDVSPWEQEKTRDIGPTIQGLKCAWTVASNCRDKKATTVCMITSYQIPSLSSRTSLLPKWAVLLRPTMESVFHIVGSVQFIERDSKPSVAGDAAIQEIHCFRFRTKTLMRTNAIQDARNRRWIWIAVAFCRRESTPRILQSKSEHGCLITVE